MPRGDLPLLYSILLAQKLFISPPAYEKGASEYIENSKNLINSSDLK